MSDESAVQLISLADRLFGEKAPFDRLCQTLADNFYPERATFTQEQALGTEFASHIFDSYPIMARRDLGNAFSSMLRPRGKEWFSSKAKGVDDLTAYGKAWLEGTAKVMRAVFYDQRTRFVRTMRETDHDFAAFGNGVLSCEPSRDRSTLLFRCWHPGQVAWGEDEAGFPTPIARKEKMSAREIARTFDRAGTVPPKVRDDANDVKKQFTEYDILHIVMPSDQWELFGSKKFRQPWVSAYVMRDGSHLLRVEGIRSKRYIIPRWQTVQGTQYALSPATIVALPDARMIQQMALILLEAGEKAVDPPTIATKNAVLSDVNIFAGGVTWVDKVYDEREGAALRALDLTGNLNFGADMLNMVRSRIADAFYLSKLTLPQGGKTAYETARLVEEYIRAAIPLFEPLETDYTQPVLDATFAELMELGAFGPMERVPDELSGKNVEFTFSNPLQETIETEKAQKFTGLAQLLQVAAGMEQLQRQAPVARNLDINTAVRDAGMAVSPASWWVDPDDMEQPEASEAEQLAAAAQAATGVKTMADAAQSVGKAGLTLNEAFTPEQEAA